MKKFNLLIALILMASSNASRSVELIDKGIYGDDNRALVTDLALDFDSDLAVSSRAVLAQVPKWRITSEDNDSISIATKSLASGLNFCPDEKFSDLPITSSCSAVLVASDLVLTAGHCLKDKYECQKNFWVIDYDSASHFEAPSGNVIFKKENVFYCSQILADGQNAKLDFALVKLNRPVPDHRPLSLRRSGEVSKKDRLYIVGHPLGLPKILADNVLVRENNLPNTFVTNADSFSGNSGSPVINQETHEVEGILVRGDEDFRMDLGNGCNRVVKCGDKECKGETVQKTTVLPLKLIPKI